MANYADKIKKLLEEKEKQRLFEGKLKYEDGHNERMLPKLEADLRDRKHSLGEHPIFPSSDESTFEQKIMSKRFGDVTRNVKRHFDISDIDNNKIIADMMGLVHGSMLMESSHKKELEALAIKMVKEEYDISDDDMNIIAELTDDINEEGLVKNPSPVMVEDMEFESHQDIEDANDEVYKRRFINAMIQGAAKKCNHMFHMVDEDLVKMNPQLPTQYNKMMSAADYMYYAIDNMEDGVKGGVVRVELPKKEGDKPTIHAQAMVFPVLIHELVKGVMEILSTHGLPQDNKLREYVIGKSDYTQAEPWDMRLGPALWEKFADAIEPADFNLKHHIYSELCRLPVKEFNATMKEIMAGTKTGKAKVASIVKDIKSDMANDDKESAINELYGEDDGFSPDELDGLDFDDFLK